MLSLSFPNVSFSSSSIATTAPSPPRRVRFLSPIASAATFEASTKSFRSPYVTLPLGMATCTSLYEVLGIPICASSQEIKAAYRRLARACHPDVAAMERKDSSTDEFIRIHAAYSTLSDPAKRAVYDGKLYRKKRPLTAMSSGGPGYRGRNWETDQCW